MKLDDPALLARHAYPTLARAEGDVHDGGCLDDACQLAQALRNIRRVDVFERVRSHDKVEVRVGPRNACKDNANARWERAQYRKTTTGGAFKSGRGPDFKAPAVSSKSSIR